MNENLLLGSLGSSDCGSPACLAAELAGALRRAWALGFGVTIVDVPSSPFADDVDCTIGVEVIG